MNKYRALRRWFRRLRHNIKRVTSDLLYALSGGRPMARLETPELQQHTCLATGRVVYYWVSLGRIFVASTRWGIDRVRVYPYRNPEE